MGLDPRTVDQLTMPEFAVMFEGFASFHGAGPKDVTREEYEAVLAEEIAAGRA